jgi:hypothetical protein
MVRSPNRSIPDSLSAADRGLCTEIVMGVLRWRARLDAAVEKLSSRTMEKLDLEVLISLRMALFQLGWLERVPKHAAVNESVELVKRARKRSAAPFVNAVLRKAGKETFTVEESRDPASLALEWSHPQWMVERWITEYGFEAARKICAFDQQIPRTVIRVVDDGAEQELVDAGIRLARAVSSCHGRELLKKERSPRYAHLLRDAFTYRTKDRNSLHCSLGAERSCWTAALLPAGRRWCWRSGILRQISLRRSCTNIARDCCESA